MFGLILEPEEKQLLPFCGMPVCLLMKDGSRKIGQLTSCGSGRLVLNGVSAGGGNATVSRKTAARRTSRKRARKPREDFDIPMPPAAEEWNGLSIAPPGPDPGFAPSPQRENVPLRSVESILIL